MIRELDERDIKAVGSLIEESFPVPWAEKDLQFFLLHECRFHFGYFQAEELIALFLSLRSGDYADVITVATAPLHRKKGYQAKLIEFIQQFGTVSHISLEVDVSNQSAINLYEKTGFHIAGVRKKYYEQKRDAFLMVWKREERPLMTLSDAFNAQGRHF